MANRKTPHRPSRLDRNAEDDDREFRAVIRSILVTKEELAAMTYLPDYSVQQVRACLCDNKRTSQTESRATGMLRALRSRVERRLRELAAKLAATIPSSSRTRNPRGS